MNPLIPINDRGNLEMTSIPIFSLVVSSLILSIRGQILIMECVWIRIAVPADN